MSITLIGRGASYEFRWRRWALLRDTVAVNLEKGASGTFFPHFASIGDALVTSVFRVPAQELGDELTAMTHALARHSLDDLMIGRATAAVLYMGARLETPRRLTRAELVEIAPIGDARNLTEYFGSMIESMLHVCAHPAEDGTLAVIDG